MEALVQANGLESRLKGPVMTLSLRRSAASYTACLGTFLSTLGISIVNVVLPTILTGLCTHIAGLQWGKAYAICLPAFMLSVGPGADRQGI